MKIQGVDNMMVRFSQCCQPIPGDEILGYVTRGRGVSIHRADCPNILNLTNEPERKIEVRWDTADDKMKIFDEKPVHQSFNIPDARLVAPGHPARSILIHRIGLRGPGQMPPLATEHVDPTGIDFITTWVKSLPQ